MEEKTSLEILFSYYILFSLSHLPILNFFLYGSRPHECALTHLSLYVGELSWDWDLRKAKKKHSREPTGGSLRLFVCVCFQLVLKSIVHHRRFSSSAACKKGLRQAGTRLACCIKQKKNIWIVPQSMPMVMMRWDKVGNCFSPLLNI